MAKFFWNYMNIKPNWYPERLSPIEDALERQDSFLLLKMTGHPETNKITDYNFILFFESEPVYSYPPRLEAEFTDEEKRKKYLRVTPDQLPWPLLKLPRDHAGSITYHGPGQLVCYLILDLEDIGFGEPQNVSFGIVRVFQAIDNALKEVLMALGVTGHSLNELIGVASDYTRAELMRQDVVRIDVDGKQYGAPPASGIWVIHEEAAKKIASRALGRIKYTYGKDNEYADQFTLFGFALNLSTDLAYFDYINPCGFGITVTSVEQITGKKHSLPKIAKMLAQALVQKVREISGDDSHELV